MIAVRCVDGLPFFTCVIRFVWRTWRCWVRMWLWTTSFTWTVPTCCLTNPSTNRSQSHESSCNIMWSKKKKKQPFIWTQLKTQTVPERERAVKEKRKKEQNNVFFTYFNSFELVFSPAWLHRPSIRNDEHMICKKKAAQPTRQVYNTSFLNMVDDKCLCFNGEKVKGGVDIPGLVVCQKVEGLMWSVYKGRAG